MPEQSTPTTISAFATSLHIQLPQPLPAARLRAIWTDPYSLDPRERHKLGAEYTPRSYVERLIRPTIIEPLRHEWKKSPKMFPQKEKKLWTSVLKLKNKVHAFN